jgi:hypothetical protein
MYDFALFLGLNNHLRIRAGMHLNISQQVSQRSRQ